VLVVFEHEFCDEERAFEVGKWIAKTLRGVEPAQRIEVGGSVVAYAHESDLLR
jgi:hypothetical protein